MEAFPSTLYGATPEDVLVVHTEDDKAMALAAGYRDSPADWGFITCPSVEDAALIDSDGRRKDWQEPAQEPAPTRRR